MSTAAEKIRELEFALENEQRQTQDLERQTQHLERQIGSLEIKFDAYVTEQKNLENKRLRAALIWSGGFILALGSFMFKEVIWPMITVGRP